jgi:hypothetical protein
MRKIPGGLGDSVPQFHEHQNPSQPAYTLHFHEKTCQLLHEIASLRSLQSARRITSRLWMRTYPSRSDLEFMLIIFSLSDWRIGRPNTQVAGTRRRWRFQFRIRG